MAEETKWSKDFLEGEISFAKAVLRRIASKRSIEHIELLCQAIIQADEEVLKSKPKR